MTPDECSESKTAIFNCLLESGCCKRCCLRFVGDGDTNYDDPEGDIQKLLSNVDTNSEHSLKRTKLNPCVICLDLLHDTTLDSMVLKPEIDKIMEYDCDTFINFISFPSCVLLREHSMEIFTKEKFPNFFKDRHITPINRAWSLATQSKLCNKLNKKFDRNSLLQIQFTASYESESEESSVMHKLGDQKKPNAKFEVSRNSINDSLKTIDAEVFKQHISVPPDVPTKSVNLEKMSYKHDFIYIAGRYCKYSRSLFQTPWVDDEGEAIKNSVQEIVFQSLNNIFNCSNMIFSSSGREDFDVRTLGRGRPFFIKICDPKITKISFEKFRLIEENIKKSELVKVRDLQIIDKKYINNIKDGEQFKRKTYRALCIVEKPKNLQIYIEKINGAAQLTLQQKTPLRVYHRRSADVREREIYSIKARPVPGRSNLFELDLITQAGTYVKEFIHGDLGRTQPSISEIIGENVDIIALDVLDIDLDFPPPVSGKA